MLPIITLFKSFIIPPDRVIVSLFVIVGGNKFMLKVIVNVSLVYVVVDHTALPIAPLPSFHVCPLLSDNTVSMLLASIVGAFVSPSNLRTTWSPASIPNLSPDASFARAYFSLAP